MVQDTSFEGTGTAPIHRYLTCANVPNIAGYLNQSILEPDIVSKVGSNIPRNASDGALRNVTFVLTDCLTATCRNSRRPDLCNYKCSGVNLLTNNTTPNMRGLNDCLRQLCTGRESSLPFADADVVDIGVFASYIMQCAFVVILWFVFIGFKMTKVKRHGARKEEIRIPSHHDMFEDFLEQFHKAQCYFSATIQIAALTYGIFDVDMLITFMLVPLAINGVLPVVFTLVLLFNCNNKSGPDVLLLTTACWLLSSLVYWTLYSHIIPINTEIKSINQEYQAYQQFYYKLSSLDACGGYSALAVCPENFRLGRGGIITESRKIRVLTPIIWTFSTVCLLATLGAKMLGVKLSEVKTLYSKRGAKKNAPPSPSMTELNYLANDGSNPHSGDETHAQSTVLPNHGEKHGRRHLQISSGHDIVYILVTLCFLAGIGMQLSLLSIATSLHMMDRRHWTFGQVVAVTVWVPPLLAYLYREVEVMVRRAKKAREARKEPIAN